MIAANAQVTLLLIEQVSVTATIKALPPVAVTVFFFLGKLGMETAM